MSPLDYALAGATSFAITFLTLGLWSLWRTWTGLVVRLNGSIMEIDR